MNAVTPSCRFFQAATEVAIPRSEHTDKCLCNPEFLQLFAEEYKRHWDTFLTKNKNNLSLENLAWGTLANNGSDKARNNSSKGSNNGRARLTEEKVIKIWKDLQIGKTAVSIAEENNVCPTTIDAIKSGRNWAHITTKLAQKILDIPNQAIV